MGVCGFCGVMGIVERNAGGWCIFCTCHDNPLHTPLRVFKGWIFLSPVRLCGGISRLHGGVYGWIGSVGYWRGIEWNIIFLRYFKKHISPNYHTFPPPPPRTNHIHTRLWGMMIITHHMVCVGEWWFIADQCQTWCFLCHFLTLPDSTFGTGNTSQHAFKGWNFFFGVLLVELRPGPGAGYGGCCGSDMFGHVMKWNVKNILSTFNEI